MSIVTVAVIIVAAALSGGVYYLAGRLGAGAWLAFSLGVFVALLVFASGGAVLKL